MMNRLPGENITHDTRAESHERVSKQVRYRQIKEILMEKPMTAKEVAVKMASKGYISWSERNYASPRLTEMSFMGIVEPIGKKKCEYTGRTVTVYDLTPVAREQMKCQTADITG